MKIINNYYNKYLKYKKKYLELKQTAGAIHDENLNYFLNFNSISEEVNEKYKWFTDLSLIKHPINLITNSANGFISSIKFENDDHKIFNTILKTSKLAKSDNLYYEFFVGMCINKIKKYIPNFISTYLYLNLTPEIKKNLQENKDYNDIENFISNTKIHGHNSDGIYDRINIGCGMNGSSGILIENIPNNLNFTQLLRTPEFKSNINYNLFCILYQIYATLSNLNNIFTHYDLHLNNVMYIKLPTPSKIVYHLDDDKVVTLFTQFIPIIIDYGRSFIDCSKIDSIISSKVFTDRACDLDDCNPMNKSQPSCYLDQGGMVVNRDINGHYSDQKDFSYKDLRNNNQSADLRFIIKLLDFGSDFARFNIDYPKFLDEIYDIIKDSNPEWFTYSYSGLANCVKESKSEYKPKSPCKIKTTSDFFQFLNDYYIEKKYNSIEIIDSYGVFDITPNLEKNTPWVFTHGSHS